MALTTPARRYLTHTPLNASARATWFRGYKARKSLTEDTIGTLPALGKPISGRTLGALALVLARLPHTHGRPCHRTRAATSTLALYPRLHTQLGLSHLRRCTTLSLPEPSSIQWHSRDYRHTPRNPPCAALRRVLRLDTFSALTRSVDFQHCARPRITDFTSLTRALPKMNHTRARISASSKLVYALTRHAMTSSVLSPDYFSLLTPPSLAARAHFADTHLL